MIKPETPLNNPHQNSTIDEIRGRTKNFSKGFRRFIKGNRLNWIAVTLVSLVVFLAIVGDLIVPYSPIELNLKIRITPPSSVHLFGTDDFGRDLFSRIIAGARISIQIAGMVLILSSTFGTLFGCVAGLLGGWVDEILMRITDLFLSFPGIVLAMAITATLGPSLTNTMLALSIVYWPWYARLIRGQVLSLREREYILASRSLGAGTSRLIFSHLLPNVAPYLITQISLDIGYVILSTSSLSFLGLGAQPPTPEWGAILTGARNLMREAWWLSAFPGLALTLTVLGFNLLGDGLRDFLDPRIRKA